MPLRIVPKNSIGRASLEALVELPAILKQEEEDAYETAAASVTHEDLITHIHNSSGENGKRRVTFLQHEELIFCILDVLMNVFKLKVLIDVKLNERFLFLF